VVFTVKKVPPFLAILGAALFAAILACFTQWTAVEAFVDDPSKGTLSTAVHAIYAAMATGFVSDSGIEPVDELFSRGGMASLLTTSGSCWPRWLSRQSWSTRASSTDSCVPS
jgi:Na+:H+ antiporter, NhaC family